MNIGILVPHGKYFAAEHLAKALNAIMYDLSCNELNVEHLIIIGEKALRKYSKLKKKNFKSVAVIFSDTNFCKYYKWCNKYTNENKIFVYAMPDLNNYCEHPYIPAYQTITLPKINIDKPTDKIIICHSPGKKGIYNNKSSKHIRRAYNSKGSNQIKIIVEELINNYKLESKIEYEVLKNLSWEECIKAKSRAHIFIDQLTKYNPYIDQKRFGGEINYNGALGKSGIEGMMLKCCTITTMDVHDTKPYFPFPPVVLTDYFDFKYDLEVLINNIEYRNDLIKKQNEWVNKYCNPKFVAMNVTRHINEII